MVVGFDGSERKNGAVGGRQADAFLFSETWESESVKGGLMSTCCHFLGRKIDNKRLRETASLRIVEPGYVF